MKNRLKKSVSIFNIQQIIKDPKIEHKKVGGKNSYEVHKENYTKKKLKLDMYWKDLYRMQKIQEEITAKKIPISKYNYAMDREVQNFDCQNAIL